MQVETFEQTEMIGEQVECSEEQIALVKSLNLSGQQELIGGSDQKETVVCPYRKMKQEERFTYETLCPDKCDVDRYSDGPIPLRVLQVIAHANSIEFFDRIQVWAATNADEKDPVLVGWHDSSPFILARWGEELDSIENMLEKARNIAKSKLRTWYKNVEAYAKRMSERMDDLDDESLFDSSDFKPTISAWSMRYG